MRPILRWYALAAFLSVCPTIRLSAQIDPTGHWRTLETEHFHVHSRVELRDLAIRAAGEAESAYAALSARLQPPRGKVDLVVADNDDETNGYASTYPSNRVVIYALPPAGDLELESYDRWLRLVITHELTHIFHLDLARGWWGVGRDVLGRAPFLFPNYYTPTWLREGLAVFYESRLTDGGRLEGAYHHAIVTAQGAEDGVMPIDEASTPTPKWPAGLRAYAFGSTFLGASADSLGDSVIARYIRRTATRAIPYLSLSGGWSAEAGQSLGDAWRGWQHGVADDAGGRQAAGGSSAAVPSELASGLRLSVPPRLSPDGRKLLLAFNDGRNATRLVIFNRDSGTSRGLGIFYSVNGVGWLPDGDALVSQLDFTDRYTIRSDLWRVAVHERNGQRRLTHADRLRDVDASENGEMVAVRIVPGGTEVVRLNPRGGVVPAGRGDSLGADYDIGVTGRHGDYTDWAQPRMDPRINRVAAVRVQNGWHDIVTITGDSIFPVTSDSVTDLQPSFSRDGRWLLWSREVNGVPQIVGIRADTLQAVCPLMQFTHEAFGAYGPEADRDTLFYLAYHADGFRLMAVPLLPESIGVRVPEPPRETPQPAATILAEHDYHSTPSLLPKYWVPQLYLTSGGGSWIGAFTTGNDVLERFAYAGSLLFGTGLTSGEYQGTLGLAFVAGRRSTFDISYSHTPAVYARDTSTTGTPAPGVITCCAPDDASRAGLTWLWRNWRTVHSLRAGLEHTHTNHERRGVSLTYGFGNVVYPALGISPQDGRRLTASVRYRRRIHADSGAVEYTLRAATYSAQGPVQYANNVVGLRLAIGSSSGNDRPNINVGGVSSDAVGLLPGVSLGAANRTFAVRGWAPGYLSAPNAVAASVEDRIPLLLIARGLGLAPIGIDKTSLNVFLDAGAAWYRITCADFATTPSPPAGSTGNTTCGAIGISSLGAELASDLAFGYSYPLRLRIGLAYRLNREKGTSAYVAFGSSF